jgi:hypothetical protein
MCSINGYLFGDITTIPVQTDPRTLSVWVYITNFIGGQYQVIYFYGQG